MIVPGSASQSLAAALARELDEPLAAVSYDRFPDGELFVTLPGEHREPRDVDRAVIVASTVDSDTHVELLLLQDALLEVGVDRIVTVIPYLGYARQDRAFNPGEPVSSRAVARAFSVATDQVITVTPHETVVCEYFDVPATAVEGADRLADPLPDSLTDPVFIAPDEGARDIAARVRDGYGAGTVDVFTKRRRSGTEVEISPGSVSVSGRDLVIVDDIISTGSTMSEAIAAVAGDEPADITVACVHPLLVGNAATKLVVAGADRIIGTDTLERPVSRVSVAPLIADVLE